MAKKETPTNTKGRKPTPKKNFSLDNFKKEIGGERIEEKPLRWIKCSSALQKSTGLPGFPVGYTSIARGFTNTGKSTAICEAIVSAQKMGILPIIIDTENNLGEERLKMMGFDWDSGFYIIYKNDELLKNYGKKQDPKRGEAAIEDMAEFIKDMLRKQENGDLPYDILFAIDSIGTLDCIRTINAQEKNTSDNNMWNAGAYEKSFKYLLNNTIPNTRRIDHEYTATLVGVQKIWIDSQGAGVVKHKGGETFFFGCRLGFHFGGIASHGTKVVTAENTSRGEKRVIVYGVETKVNVFKNQIDGPLGGISLQGEIMSMPHGFIFKEDLDSYKKENIKYFREKLNDDSITADDIVDKIVRSDADDLNVEDFVDAADES